MGGVFFYLFSLILEQGTDFGQTGFVVFWTFPHHAGRVTVWAGLLVFFTLLGCLRRLCLSGSTAGGLVSDKPSNFEYVSAIL